MVTCLGRSPHGRSSQRRSRNKELQSRNSKTIIREVDSCDPEVRRRLMWTPRRGNLAMDRVRDHGLEEARKYSVGFSRADETPRADSSVNGEGELIGEVSRGISNSRGFLLTESRPRAIREEDAVKQLELQHVRDFLLESEESKGWKEEKQGFDDGWNREGAGLGDTCETRGSRKWKKVVYGGMQKGFEDNHTDASFLEALVMNANVVKRDTGTAMRASVAISQYVCVVAIVAAVWTYSLNADLDAPLLLLLDALQLLFGVMVLLLTTGSISVGLLYRYALYFTFFVSGLYVLAPVFQTLTRSISSDSIWALTVFLLTVHLFFHDYTDSSIRPPASDITSKAPAPPATASKTIPINLSKDLAVKKPTTLSGNVSLNASIVASVLVASRLPSRLLVFALMLFSSEFFLLFPLVTHCIKQYSVKLHIWFSCMLIVVAMGLIFPLNRLALVLFVAVVVFIMLVCPYWLIRIQEYKFEINGPWDEAKLCFDLD